jgi:hypothetical protein
LAEPLTSRFLVNSFHFREASVNHFSLEVVLDGDVLALLVGE